MAPRTTKPCAKGRKPHTQSVTSVACRCSTLQDAVDEPDCPVAFDPEIKEYNIADRRGGTWRIYHCFFCGGAVPRSKRSSQFATVPQREKERLQELTKGFADLNAVIARFGKPDEDMDPGIGDARPATDERGPTYATYRMLRYHGLSDVADVEFVDYGPKHGVRASFQGKYLGRPKSSGA